MEWNLAKTLAVGGTMMGAYSQYAQGLAASAEADMEARQAQYNALNAERTARQIEMKTKFDQIRQAQQAQRIMGTLRAKLGASGAMLSEGAPLAVQADQLMELELENAMIGWEGRNQADVLNTQANLFRAEGSLAKLRGKNAENAATWGTANTLLSGFASMYQQGMFAGSKKGSSTIKGMAKGYSATATPGAGRF